MKIRNVNVNAPDDINVLIDRYTSIALNIFIRRYPIEVLDKLVEELKNQE